jgi:putative transcriptional regulator
MSNIKAIRERLELTQTALGDGIGCTQGNIGHYERGQTLSSPMAKRLIDFAAERGLVLTFDHIYGDSPLPELIGATGAPTPEPEAKAA